MPKNKKNTHLLCTCLDNQSWRRKRDLNPRELFTPNGFRDHPLQPLGYSSSLLIINKIYIKKYLF